MPAINRKHVFNYVAAPVMAEIDVDTEGIEELREKTDEACRLEGVGKKRKLSSRQSSTRTRTVLKDKFLSDESVGQARGFTCKCEEQCADLVSRSDIFEARKSYWSLKQQDRLQHLVNEMVFHADANVEEQTVNFRTSINGKKVCGPFFKVALGVTQQMYANARTRVRHRQVTVLPKESTTNVRPKRDTVVDFLNRYVEEHGQAVPNKNIRELPIGLTRTKLYCEYLDKEFTEEEIHGRLPAAQSSFMQWVREFRSLKFRKWMTFSQCSICKELKSNIEKATSKEQKGKWFC